jgi:hypothetical protein
MFMMAAMVVAVVAVWIANDPLDFTLRQGERRIRLFPATGRAYH